MDLNNITMDDLKAKFAAFDKKTLIKFGIGFGSIILFLIIYYAILNPMVKERKAKFQGRIIFASVIISLGLISYFSV